MGLSNFFKQLFLTSCLSLLSYPGLANQHPSEQHADKIIDQLYHKLNKMPKSDMPTRMTFISQQLLGKPYLLGALGEGTEGRYDQSPLYRTDAFDCETYVDTVLALAFANNLSTFKQCIRRIRYRNAQVSFIDRNHFLSLDWNLNNQRQGFIKDITTTFKNEQGKPVAKMADALINKPGWYQHLTPDKIHLNGMDLKERTKRLDALKRKGNQLKRVISSIPYLPLTALFNKNGKANDHLFNQIPNASIIEIIRPNWDLEKKIGTCLNASHLGLAFWDKDTLLYREASSIHKQTLDIPLIDYLREARKSPTIKGINVHVVLPTQPLSENCIP